MKFHDLIGLAGFGLIIAACYLRYGLDPALGLTGGGLLLSALAMARRGGR